jgi:hypothetical protein
VEISDHKESTHTMETGNMTMNIEDKIDRILESFFVKDLIKITENTILRIRLTPEAKIDNILEAVKCR